MIAPVSVRQYRLKVLQMNSNSSMSLVIKKFSDCVTNSVIVKEQYGVDYHN